MIALKMLLTVAGVLLLATAVAIPLYGLWLRIQMACRKAGGEEIPDEPKEIEWRGPAALVLVACLPLLVATSIVVVPSGMGGVRVSQFSGTLPGTLYPGLHFVTPLVESVETFGLRDHLFTAGLAEEGAKPGAQKKSRKSRITNSETLRTRSPSWSLFFGYRSNNQLAKTLCDEGRVSLSLGGIKQFPNRRPA